MGDTMVHVNSYYDESNQEDICKFVMNRGTEKDIEMMDQMLRDGRIRHPNVKCKKWYNGTALMYQSSFNGTFKAMEFLIKKGARVNLMNDLRETALYWAVGCTKETGIREKIYLLLREGAQVLGLKNTSGQTLIEACDNEEMKAELQVRANEENILQQQEERKQQEKAMYEERSRKKREEQLERDRIKMTEDAEKHNKIKQTFIEEERQRERQRQILVEAEREQKQTLAKAEAKASSDPDEKEYKQTIEMTRFKGGKTKKTRRKRRKTRKYKKSRKSRKSRR